MGDLVRKRSVIDAVMKYCMAYDLRELLADIDSLPSAQSETMNNFITWLLDNIWDDEMWALNWEAFPEMVCRKLEKLGYVMLKDGEYERFDRQTRWRRETD